VRAADPQEFARVGELTVAAFHALGPGVPVEPDYERELLDVAGRAGEGVVLVAVDEQWLMGSVTLVGGGSAFAEIAAPDEMTFRMLAVDPSAQGRGVGAALVEACRERASAAGVARLVISTAVGMHAAHRLYERQGFTRDATRDWEPYPGLTLLAYRLDLR
jgi:ribosomal protein S18 acetylase RimI-like enzyme